MRLKVTFPPVPPHDVNGLPVEALTWNVYESGALVGSAPVSAPTYSYLISEHRDYVVQIALVNSVGEGALSGAKTINFPAPPARGVPEQPYPPTLTLEEDGYVVPFNRVVNIRYGSAA